MSIKVLNQDNFQEAISNATLPVIIDFYADWCGPCKMITPILEEIATEEQDKLIIYKVNVDESQAIASQYSVSSIPTLIVFKNGEIHNTLVGAGSKETIVELIN